MPSDSNPPFEAPPGYSLLDSDSVGDGDEFDWDAINNNPNLDLWLIRIPNSLSAKHLQSFTFSTRNRSKLGELTRKENSYVAWSCATNGDEPPQAPIYGEEMKAITCLLPRRSKGGRLYTAPKPFSRHVVFTPKPAQPQPVSESDPSAVTVYQNPPRQSYPPELLKHRFMPYGSLALIGSVEKDEERTEGHKPKQKTKIKSKDKPDKNAIDASTMEVPIDIKPLNAGTKEKKDKKEKQSKHGVEESTAVQNTSHLGNLPADTSMDILISDTKEKRDRKEKRSKHDAEESTVGNLPATEDSKPSKVKKRKGGGEDISGEEKKRKKLKAKDA